MEPGLFQPEVTTFIDAMTGVEITLRSVRTPAGIAPLEAVHSGPGSTTWWRRFTTLRRPLFDVLSGTPPSPFPKVRAA